MPKRSYRQYCALARALDVIGDRWNLLIVRNLLLGPQTWSELRHGLPGIAKNLLSERLSSLEIDGVLAHNETAYELTDVGRALEPAVFALAAWGEQHYLGPPSEEEAIRLRYLMTSIRRKLQPTAMQTSVQLHIGGDSFVVELGSDPVVRQGTTDADATVKCTLGGIRALIFERTPVEELAATSMIDIRGQTDAVETFRRAVK